MNKKNKYIQVIDYEAYTIFMESKKVRYGKDRTYTLYDFITNEEVIELNKNNETDLSKFNPTPKAIEEHFNFANKTARRLLKIYPNDQFLKSLEEEKYQVLKVTTSWYELYDVTYPVKKTIELQKVKFIV